MLKCESKLETEPLFLERGAILYIDVDRVFRTVGSPLEGRPE